MAKVFVITNAEAIALHDDFAAEPARVLIQCDESGAFGTRKNLRRNRIAPLRKGFAHALPIERLDSFGDRLSFGCPSNGLSHANLDAHWSRTTKSKSRANQTGKSIRYPPSNWFQRTISGSRTYRPSLHFLSRAEAKCPIRWYSDGRKFHPACFWEVRMSQNKTLRNDSRRMFLQMSVAAAAASAFRIVNEPLLAAAAIDRDRNQFPPGAVVINANENPLGPCDAARAAVVSMAPQGGRYSYWLTDELVDTFAQQQGLKREYIRTFPGSSEPLHFSVLAFTSPTRSYVAGDPGYESGGHAAKISGAREVNVPLTKSYAHDIPAMLAAAPDAGLFYVCTPNNPTGTLTPHADIEQLVFKKPNGTVVLVDEAYIHFADGADTAIDLVKANQDVIVLRTFSKIYGMAGLRCGFAIARPDLLAKLENCGGWSALPITAVAAATASLKHEHLVSERKLVNTTVRQKTLDWLDRNGYSYVPSQTNFFMVDTKRPAKQVIDSMAAKNVFIGRIWPVWPTYARITVGTQAEMDAFTPAFDAVMKNAKTVSFARPASLDNSRRIYADGQMLPGTSS